VKLIGTLIVLTCFIFGCFEDKTAETFQVDKPNSYEKSKSENVEEIETVEILDQTKVLFKLMLYKMDLQEYLISQRDTTDLEEKFEYEFKIFQIYEIMNLLTSYYNDRNFNEEEFNNQVSFINSKYDSFTLPSGDLVDPCKEALVSDYVLKIDKKYYLIKTEGYDFLKSYDVEGQILPYHSFCTVYTDYCYLLKHGSSKVIEFNEIIELNMFVIEGLELEPLSDGIFSDAEGFSCTFQIKGHKIKKL